MDSRFAVLKRSQGTSREIPAKAQRKQGAQGRLEAGVSGGGCSKCTLPGVLAARKPVQWRGRRPEGGAGAILEQPGLHSWLCDPRQVTQFLCVSLPSSPCPAEQTWFMRYLGNDWSAWHCVA